MHKHAFRGLVLCAALVSSSAIAATGRVTDRVTGAPIEGATVLAVWYYVPPMRFTLAEGHNPSRLCGGAAVARTNAAGEYDLGAWIDSKDHKPSETAFWVSARGYYDPAAWIRLGNATSPTRFASLQRLHTMFPVGWSRALIPLRDEDIDIRLAGADAASTAQNCASAVANAQSAQDAFDRAVRADISATLCSDGDTTATPSTDVFRGLSVYGLPAPDLWRELVTPLLPVSADARIPSLALHNACVLLSTPRAADAAGSMDEARLARLRITVKDASSGRGVANAPVRILWGARNVERREYDFTHRSLIPRSSFLATTDADGVVDLPVTPAMLDEQAPSAGHASARFAYSVVSLASDRIGFDPKFSKLPYLCAARDPVDFATWSEFTAGLARVRGGTFCAGAESIAPDTPTGISPTRGIRAAAPHSVAAPTRGYPSPAVSDAYVELNRIAEEENARRAAHEYRPEDSATLYTYTWRWPADALIERAYALLIQSVDREENPEALLAAQRREVENAFHRLCAGPRDSTLKNGEDVSRTLWWIQTQTQGVDAANRDAQNRVDHWDDGSRCTYTDGRLVSVGGTNPPNLLTAAKVCAAWRSAGSFAGARSIAAPVPFDEFKVDYSRRPGACEHLQHKGASL